MARQRKVIELKNSITDEERVVLTHLTQRFVAARQEAELRWKLLEEYAAELAAAHNIDLSVYELNVSTGEFIKKSTPAPKE